MTLSTTIKRWFTNPTQLRGRRGKFTSVIGRIGFVTKAIVYGLIGYLCIASAATHENINKSPQGVFILLGSPPNNIGLIFLYIIAIGLLMYLLWRLIEGLTGQGYHRENSHMTNCFRYRLSPIVSGTVYLLYLVFVINLIIKAHTNDTTAPEETCFLCWTSTVVGKIALALLGTCFIIASLTQVVTSIRRSFMNDLQPSGRVTAIMLAVTGVIGFAARGILFIVVAVYFFMLLTGGVTDVDQQHQFVGQALDKLSWANSDPLLYILGSGLLVYSVFALLNTRYKRFPTVTIPT